MTFRRLVSVAAIAAAIAAASGVSVAQTPTFKSFSEPRPTTEREAYAPDLNYLAMYIGLRAKIAQDDPQFASMSPEQKIARIKWLVASGIADMVFTPELLVQALNKAVADGKISAGAAVAVGRDVSDQMALQVANQAAVKAGLEAQGVNIITASTTGSDAPSVLVSLYVASQLSTGSTSAAVPPSTAPYDPCASVVAAYCG